ncbi:sulfotransferase domain-containing protein [Nisaea acidiphila]|uniref:Sulfotransferase domain-containing protein n=1 Tax=Nisaea acidiphila TaxID=1862145 RepID=A0A9J7ARU0_9PROT|nr:sulfotransferase domain-containing protein [Nisaea acidiphila]UUX49926.1 sulfotransferase domain-containing protein [Nisaea acidiphila]
MSRIIWLASYPKSGNTWMRAFLANYFLDRDEPVRLSELNEFTLSDTIPSFYAKAACKPAEQITLEESVAIRPAVQRLMAASKPNDHFVKTHSQPSFPNGAVLIDPAISLGAVYITRDPLDLVHSYATHFGVSLDLAIRDMGDIQNTTVSPREQIASYLGSWSGHVTNWTDAGKLPVCVVRYEDLLETPDATFGAVLKTLRIPIDDARVKRAVAHASFKSLANLEEQDGFAERSPHTERFFRSGRAGDGASKLSKRQIKQLVRDHGAVMERFGYRH